VAQGKLRFWLGEEESIVTKGDSVYVAPDVPHRVEALEDAVVVDTFSPPREDFR
jgi:quercetin dioxygenase-like cupin family protein